MSSKKKLMKSGKVAKILGVTKMTINRWVASGKLIPDVVSEKGYNLFSEENVTLFKNAEESKRNIPVVNRNIRSVPSCN